MKSAASSPIHFHSTRRFLASLAAIFIALLGFHGSGALITSAFAASDPPFALPARADVLKLKSARVETERGDLYFDLFPEIAPWHVANFKFLADKGVYQDSEFHIVQPGYIIQGGRTKLGSTYSIPAEFSEERHVFGSLGMARMPDDQNSERRSHGSQFHMTLVDSPHMNARYTIFGKLASGSQVLEKLKKGDRILNVTVFVRPE